MLIGKGVAAGADLEREVAVQTRTRWISSSRQEIQSDLKVPIQDGQMECRLATKPCLNGPSLCEGRM